MVLLSWRTNNLALDKNAEFLYVYVLGTSFYATFIALFINYFMLIDSTTTKIKLFTSVWATTNIITGEDFTCTIGGIRSITAHM